MAHPPIGQWVQILRNSEVGTGRSNASACVTLDNTLASRNPLCYAQTPHVDGVCAPAGVCSLKAHTGFEPVPPP